LLLLICLFGSPPAQAADLPLLRDGASGEFDGAWGQIGLVAARAGSIVATNASDYLVETMLVAPSAATSASDGNNIAGIGMESQSAVLSAPDTITYLAQCNSALIALGSGQEDFTLRWRGGSASSAKYFVLPDPNDPSVTTGIVEGYVYIIHTDNTGSAPSTGISHAGGGVTDGSGQGFLVNVVSANGVVQVLAQFNGQIVFSEVLPVGENRFFRFEFPVPVSVGDTLSHSSGAGSDVTVGAGGTDSAGVSSSVSASFKVRGLVPDAAPNNSRPRFYRGNLSPQGPIADSLELVWEQPDDQGEGEGP